jgi:hypothetical protein
LLKNKRNAEIDMTIIFDMHPSFGHHHATYKLAGILEEAGHRRPFSLGTLGFAD